MRMALILLMAATLPLYFGTTRGSSTGGLRAAWQLQWDSASNYRVADSITHLLLSAAQSDPAGFCAELPDDTVQYREWRQAILQEPIDRLDDSTFDLSIGRARGTIIKWRQALSRADQVQCLVPLLDSLEKLVNFPMTDSAMHGAVMQTASLDGEGGYLWCSRLLYAAVVNPSLFYKSISVDTSRFSGWLDLLQVSCFTDETGGLQMRSMEHKRIWVLNRLRGVNVPSQYEALNRKLISVLDTLTIGP